LLDYVTPYFNIFLKKEAAELLKYIKYNYTINLEEGKDLLY